ncbi:MAG: BON domain-containing protein [Sphingomonas sp.]
MKTDSQLQKDVIDELAWEPSIEHGHIGVAVNDGVVTLSGYVKSYAEKMAAEKTARRVAGVRGIAEEIKVRFASDPKTSDAEIAKRIIDIFAFDVMIPDDKLTVKVEHGWVTLTGAVDWHYQREAARTAAGRITGVVGISNLIEVRKVPTAFDVKQRIVDAFKRAADTDAGALDVVTADGTVRLSGRVHSLHERQVAERAAWAAPGVTRIEDNIVIS